jgi:signal transduction histidine kinase/FixJ family two-component response regulator
MGETAIVQAGSVHPHDPHRVLVVDDVEEVAEVISRMLGDAGLSSEFVCSGRDALAALDKTPCDVVISDVRMPEMNGIDLLREIKNRDRGKVVILITAHDIDPLLRETQGYESVYVLRKPVALVELMRIIEGALAEREATRENLRLRALVHGLSEVNREADFQRGLDRILSLAIDLTGADSGSIMVDDHEGNLVVAASIGPASAALGATAPQGNRSISGYVARTGTPLLVTPSLKDHPVFGDLMRRKDASSAMSVPLVHRNELLGVLNLNRKSDHQSFDDHDMELARLMAEAVTLHAAQLLTHARTQRALSSQDRPNLLGEFLAGLEHELRNPLTAIVGYAQLLHANKDGKADEHLKKLIVNVDRVQKVLEALRASYTPTQRMPAPFDVNAMLEDSVRYVRFQNPTNLVDVQLDLDNHLLPARGVEEEMVQVFVNLLNNAFQAITQKGEVRVTTRRDPAGVLVTVSDNGRGIPAENISKIFEPFFSTRRGSGGTGLGLAITRTLVTRHGGTIEVDSAPGRGTTFRVRLPSAT